MTFEIEDDGIVFPDPPLFDAGEEFPESMFTDITDTSESKGNDTV